MFSEGGSAFLKKLTIFAILQIYSLISTTEQEE